ncbi:MAG: hypothetical protein ACTHQM_19230 [Thermoanaerobaculia bacterium]
MNKCQVCDEREVTHPRSGECSTCYKRRYWREHYKAEHVSEADRRDPIGLAAALTRVRRVRGAASLHMCSDCFRNAVAWHYIPGDDYEQTAKQDHGIVRWSPNPDAYEPLCTSCGLRKEGIDA